MTECVNKKDSRVNLSYPFINKWGNTIGENELICWNSQRYWLPTKNPTDAESHYLIKWGIILIFEAILSKP